MTRPRSQQINDPATRYTSIPLRVNPTPGSDSISISGADYTNFLSATATQLTTGNEELLPASIVGTVTDPYPLLSPGQQFSVSVDGNAPVLVTIDPSDFVILNAVSVSTTHRIAARINTALSLVNPSWSNVASRTIDGYLKLTSPTLGPDSSISISSVLLSIIQGMGFNTNPTDGSGSSYTRGVVTKSEDALGGYVFPSYSDGRKITCNTSEVHILDLLGEFVIQSIPAGSPILGRITHDDITPSFNIDWYSKCQGSPSLSSSFSDFVQLGSGETLTIDFADIYGQKYSCSATFSSSPVDVSDVADVINAGIEVSRGQVRAFVSEPYHAIGLVIIRLNGNTVNINLDTETQGNSASSIVSAINSVIALAGYAAEGQAVLSTNTKYFKIESLLPINGGVTSTVEILNTSDASVLRSLGLKVGKYVGTHICKVVGAEIEINPPSPSSTISISGTALNYLGLSSYPVSPAIIPVEDKLVRVVFPQDSNSDFITSEYSVNLLVPEYMEAGDIQDNNFTRERLDDYTPLYNQRYQDVNDIAESFSGQARYDVKGELFNKSIPFYIESAKIGELIFNNTAAAPTLPVSALYLDSSYSHPIIESFSSSTTPSIRTFIYSEAGTPGYSVTSNLYKIHGLSGRYNYDIAAQSSTILDIGLDHFSISLRSASAANPFIVPHHLKFTFSSIPGISYQLALKSNTVLDWPDSSAKITDTNITSFAPSGYLPISSSGTFGSALKLHDKTVSRSILDYLNSRYYITTGDGVNTFGDFNGFSALSSVSSFLTSLPTDLRPVTIYMKKGTYKNNDTVVFNRPVTINADPGTIIQSPLSGNDTLEFQSDYDLYNLIIESAGSGSFSISSGTFTRSVIDNCTLNDSYFSPEVSINSFPTIKISRSRIFGLVTAFTLDVSNGEVLSFICTDSFINNTGNGDVENFKVIGEDVTIHNISFYNCKFLLSECTIIPPSPPFSRSITFKNTGLIELYPLNDGRTNPGLVVKNVSFNYCDVTADSGDVNIILQVCSAQTNKVSSDYSLGNPWGTINSLVFNGSRFSSKLSSSADASISYFLVGQGIDQLTINHCEFNPVISNLYGAYGYLPEWTLYTMPSFTSATGYSGGITIACDKLQLTNSTVKNLSVNTAFDIYSCDIMVCSNNVYINNNYIKFDDTYKGDGVRRDSIFVMLKENDVLSPIYSDESVYLLNLMTIQGAIFPSDDVSSNVFHIIDLNNFSITNSKTYGFGTNAVTPGLSGILIESINSLMMRNINIMNNYFNNVDRAINLEGRLDDINVNNNLVYYGNYHSAFLLACYGIRMSGLINEINYCNIDSNYVEAVPGSTISPLFAGIDLTIPSRDFIADLSTVPLRLTNNYSRVDNSSRDSFSLKPPAFSSFSTKYPKGFIYNNTGYVEPFTGNPTFKVKYFDFSTTSLASIDDTYNTIIPPGSLYGLETSDNAIELTAANVAAVLVLSGAWTATGSPISFSNGSVNCSIYITYQLRILVNAPANTNVQVDMRIVDGSSALVNNSFRSLTALNATGISTDIRLVCDITAEYLSSFGTETFDVEFQGTPGVTISVFHIAIIKSNKFEYRNGQKLLRNQLYLST